MKTQKRTKLIRRINEEKTDSFGEALYFRPFAEDDVAIAQIAAQTGEKKSRIAQRLVRIALAGKTFEHNPNEKILAKLDWLVARERARSLAENTAAEVPSEQIVDKLGDIDSRLASLQTFAAESYCLATISASYLNLIFTKLVEYSSPTPLERQNSSDLANRNALTLIEHSLAELDKLLLHHDISAPDAAALYLSAKIESLESRLANASDEAR